jgi:hypothetical protein
LKASSYCNIVAVIVFVTQTEYHKLKIDDRIEVDTGKGWIEMRVGHDFEGYYLDGKEISFYPKMVYARLVEAGKKQI